MAKLAPGSNNRGLADLDAIHAYVQGIHGSTVLDDGHSPEGWRGWKFLITAEHVLGDRSDIIVRLNRTDIPAFKCELLHLVRSGANQNVFVNNNNDSDLVAISLPNISQTDPAHVGALTMASSHMLAGIDPLPLSKVYRVGH